MDAMISPCYARSFLCIGSECPRTCCTRWTVPVDGLKKQLYDECADKLMRDKFNKYIVPFKEGLRAYRIKFSEDGVCPFLNADMLCQMQLRLGADWLPAACAYPRRAVIINGVPELSMVLSCPVTAGLALYLDGDMRFEERPVDLPPHITEIELDSPYAAFAAARGFLIEILQFAKLPFETRLAMLGIFIEREWRNNFVDIIQHTEDFRRYMEKCAKDGKFGSVTRDYALQFGVISKLLEGMAGHAPIAEYGALLAKCGEGLNKVQERLLNEGIHQDPYAVVTREFKEHASNMLRVFQNYFVNEVFRESLACAGFRDNGFALPEQDAEALYKCYMLWCVSYRMLYFQFACLYALNGELSRVDVVDVVTLFCRAAFTHDSGFSEEFCEWMRGAGMADVPSLTRIVMS